MSALFLVRLASGGLYQSEDVEVYRVRACSGLSARSLVAARGRMTDEAMQSRYRVSVRVDPGYPVCGWAPIVGML